MHLHSIRHSFLRLHKICVYLLSALMLLSCSQLSAKSESNSDQPEHIHTIAIDNVWSGHRIKPYLLTRGEHQFVAYFDANRQMTIAHRAGKKTWRFHKVDSWLGWDSHNYVTMELDAEGHLHVMGNMHSDPIEYFRMTEPYNVRSLTRFKLLVDQSVERQVTYPIFLLNKDKQLIVKYRDGTSGNGSEIYNIFNTQSKSWARLHANTFLDGEGKMSGYFEGPTFGPDGYFHLIWVWRDTPNAATNHDLSYAKSADLVNWLDSNNKPISLPITLKKAEIVAPVPAFGGMINNNVKIGFDHQNKPVITYHKYDANGDTQMYIASKDGKGWKSTQISDWKGFRWDFGGGGSLGRFPIQPFSPEIHDDNFVRADVRKHDDILRFVLNKNTLQTVRIESVQLYPIKIEKLSEEANKHIHRDKDTILELSVFNGKGETSGVFKDSQFYLSWKTQPGNRDRAHGKITQPSTLLLHEFKK